VLGAIFAIGGCGAKSMRITRSCAGSMVVVLAVGLVTLGNLVVLKLIGL
jgi:hypothetical protein